MSNPELFYNRIADDFDEIMNQYELRKRVRLIFAQLLPESLAGKRVLDVGCGTGWFTGELLARGAKVVSSDIGHQLVNLTRTKHNNTTPVQCSAEALSFTNDYFDIVLCTEVIEHTRKPELSVRELMRVLRPGGLLILTTPNRVWHFSVFVADLLKVRPYRGHENWISRGELRMWTRDNDGRLEKSIGFNLFPLFYKPFFNVLDFADKHLQVFRPIMVNMGARIVKLPRGT